MSTRWVLTAIASLAAAGCNSQVIVSDAGGPVDYGSFDNVDAAIQDVDNASRPDAAIGGPDEDAFFINDAPPPYCGPDGERMEPRDPGGTDDCPEDKSRQGCPCPEAGEEAPCWPGRREHRNRGICEDGTAVCQDTIEFGLQWGACKGYVLPEEEAESGAEACDCFSTGRWELDNLVPCLQEKDGRVYMYSSSLDDDGSYVCETLPSPPPAPETAWANSVLSIDCEGRFELCYTIKAGDDENPRDDDCIIMRQCFDLWYEEARKEMPLELAGWASNDGRCGRRFSDMGGYGEMTVQGLSVQCDAVDDGDGNPRVFFRTNYCPPDCNERPDDEECRSCTTGGAGDF